MAGMTMKKNQSFARDIVALLPSVPGAAVGRSRFTGPFPCLTRH